MQILLGNPNPLLPPGETREGPCVTAFNIPTGSQHYPEGHHGYVQVQNSGLTGDALAVHIARAQMHSNGLTRLPGHEPVLLVANGGWDSQARPGTIPLWVSVTDEDSDAAAETERILSEFFVCERGVPVDVEDTHHTFAGPPGVYPPVDVTGRVDFEGNITQNGRDMQARNAYGGQVGAVGSGSAATSTTFTTASTFTSNQWAGYRVFAYSTSGGIVWGNISANTSGANGVLTVDRWYNPATPGGAAATTPTTPWGFVISDGGAPAWFMGLSASTTALATPSTNTSLPGEITTASGGLVRQICPWAHTASAATVTLTPIFTANASDSLPVSIGSIGTFNSMVVADNTSTMYFNSLLASTATLSAVNDQLTVTQTITGT